ncbi:MAG TPA: O-acetyl-ADP-ribose deacetylase [Kofleriaceae bacterium]|jgi:O-acetyl-ADP-ribose deacetylase (regulator of RNase III)
MWSVNGSTIELVTGDITKLAVDTIVNAANSALSGGGGVDGAIHRAAGPELLAECRTLGRCPTGDARITKGYRLHARHVIHAVGPVWQGGGSDERALLASVYRNCMRLAVEAGVSSIAFPSISTGVYRFPIKPAASIAVREVVASLAAGATGTIKRVVFCAFSDDDSTVYRATLDAELPPGV